MPAVRTPLNGWTGDPYYGGTRGTLGGAGVGEGIRVGEEGGVGVRVGESVEGV